MNGLTKRPQFPIFKFSESSLYKSKESVCVCVCVCVYVCLKYLFRSGSDWPESFNMTAAWFKGVQCHICLDYNDTINKLFQRCFTNSASIVNHSHHCHYVPEPITAHRSHVFTRANHCRAHPHNIPWEKSAGSSVPFSAAKLTVVDILRLNEEIRTRGDDKLELVKMGFCPKVSTSSKCLQARKHVSIGGKRHHTNQSQS